MRVLVYDIEGCSGIITQKPQSQEVQFFLAGSRLACEDECWDFVDKGIRFRKRFLLMRWSRLTSLAY